MRAMQDDATTPAQPPASASHSPLAAADHPLAAVDAAWTALHRHLERRRAELDLEVRRYPRPISRCDVQLPGLLDERQRVVRVLAQGARVAAAPGASRAAPLAALLAQTRGGDEDEVESALRAALARALGAAGFAVVAAATT